MYKYRCLDSKKEFITQYLYKELMSVPCLKGSPTCTYDNCVKVLEWSPSESYRVYERVGEKTAVDNPGREI